MEKDDIVLMAARASRLENQDAIDFAIVSMLPDPKEVKKSYFYNLCLFRWLLAIFISQVLTYVGFRNGCTSFQLYGLPVVCVIGCLGHYHISTISFYLSFTGHSTCPFIRFHVLQVNKKPSA